jgi:hypothetical protein
MSVETFADLMGIDKTITFKWTADANGVVTMDPDDRVWVQKCTVHEFLSIPGSDCEATFNVSIPATIKIPRRDHVEEYAQWGNILGDDGNDLVKAGNHKLLAYPFTLPHQCGLEIAVSSAGAGATGIFFLKLWDEDK